MAADSTGTLFARPDDQSNAVMVNGNSVTILAGVGTEKWLDRVCQTSGVSGVKDLVKCR